jgi:tRNA-dihydrouridine synthase 2
LTTKLTLGAESVMLARSAERNPSVFQPTGPVCTVTEIVPRLLNIAQYTDNPWGNTKFLLMQFKPSAPPISSMTKAQRKEAQESVSRSKSLVEVAEKLRIDLNRGGAVMREIEARLRERSDGDVWKERKEAEDKGEVLDEPIAAEDKAEEDGWEVGVGPASVAHP